MRRLSQPTSGALALLALAGCLDPMVADDVPLGDAIGDPAAALLHVEDDPANRARLAQFTSRIDYLKGFADGEAIWYWNANGPVPELIAQMFVVTSADGAESPPIIDALPGEPGYSPWWRKVTYRATAQRTNQRFTSRAALDEGVALGLLEAPEVTTTIVTAVVALRAIAPVELGDGMTASPTLAYYRGREAAWIQWSHTVERPLAQKELDALPVFILHRIDEPLPIYELVANLDLNGDGKINASNNVFAAGVAATDYTPNWVPNIVRTVPDLPSIDTSSAAPPVRREEDLVRDGQPRPEVAITITPQPRFVNCPIQVTRGQL